MSTQLVKHLRASGMLGLGISDIHGHLVETNDEYLNMLGYTRDDLEQGRFQWDKCTAPEHLMRDHRAIRDVLETGRCAPFEKEYIRKDGTRVPVLVGLSPISDLQDQFVFYCADLSASPRDDSYMTDAVNAANTGTWDWSIATGRFIWSEKTANLVGYEASDEPSFDNLWRRIHPEDRGRVRAQVEKMLAEQREEQLEFRVCPPDGPERWLLAKGALFFSQAGGAVRASGTVVDISDWKRNEKALEEALKARNQFLSVASHELRTPLTSIRLRAEMLLRQGVAAADGLLSFAGIEGSLRSIVRQLTRMDVLVSDMLDASRLLHGKMNLDPESVNVTAMLDAFVANARDEHAGASLLAWEPPLDPTLLKLEGLWSRRRVEQVLDNLLSNAMKYGAGRPVTVRLGEADAGWVTIEMADAGIGIPEGLQDKIFQPFERATTNAEYPGFGLGLFIVNEIVKAQGGWVSVESHLGEGSTFRVHLPLKPTRRR